MSNVTNLIKIFDTVLSVSNIIHPSEIVGIQLSALCKQLFETDYLEFCSDYNDLIEQITEDIRNLKNIKENKKDEYVQRLNQARDIFAPENLAASWQHLFSLVREGNLRNFLSIIEGFLDHDAGLVSVLIDKNEVLKSINDLEEIIQQSSINEETKIFISAYIATMRIIITAESSYKDRKIVQQYEALLGKMIVIYGGENIDDNLEPEQKSKLKNWFGKAMKLLSKAPETADKAHKVLTFVTDVKDNLLNGAI